MRRKGGLECGSGRGKGPLLRQWPKTRGSGHSCKGEMRSCGSSPAQWGARLLRHPLLLRSELAAAPAIRRRFTPIVLRRHRAPTPRIPRARRGVHRRRGGAHRGGRRGRPRVCAVRGIGDSPPMARVHGAVVDGVRGRVLIRGRVAAGVVRLRLLPGVARVAGVGWVRRRRAAPCAAPRRWGVPCAWE